MIIEVRNNRELTDVLDVHAVLASENLSADLRERFEEVLDLIATRQPYTRRLRLAMKELR